MCSLLFIASKPWQLWLFSTRDSYNIEQQLCPWEDGGNTYEPDDEIVRKQAGDDMSLDTEHQAH